MPMLGFLKNIDNSVAIANRIFESKMYNTFLSEEELTQGLEAAPAILEVVV